MCQVIEKEAIDFYSHYKADSFLPFLIEHICTGPIIAMELMAEDAIARWNETVGKSLLFKTCLSIICNLHVVQVLLTRLLQDRRPQEVYEPSTA